MAESPRIIAVPLSALPELQELLSPFLGGAAPRQHVVMVRLGDESAERLDELVEAGLCGSRSEAAAFLIGAGIVGQSELFSRISEQAAEIKRLRETLRETARATLGRRADSDPAIAVSPDPVPRRRVARQPTDRSSGRRTSG